VKPAWFPDWTGETCVIIAGGPSAGQVNIGLARGKAKVITINTSWRLAPWADVLYSCDDAFWRTNKGVEEFPGLKISQDASAVARFPHLLKRVVCRKVDELLTGEPGTIGWGGNSGFQAINLAVQFGAKKLILVGYDMRLDRGLHWHGAHPKSMNNPTPRNVERWCRAVDSTAPILAQMGIPAINCSPVSMLTAFPKMSLAEALTDSPHAKPMKILAIGNEINSPSQITSFSGVYTYYLRRELAGRGIGIKFSKRPDKTDAERYYSKLEIDFDHVIAFGSRHFNRLPGKIARDVSKRIRGAVCQFNDSPLRDSNADLTFVCKGAADAKNKVIGWAADPELCLPRQSRDVLHILIDHRDYVEGRGDIFDAVVNDAESFKESELWRRQFKSVEIATLGSPKHNPRERMPFDELCAEYSKAHLFLLTHPESVGLSVIESAMAGALAVVPNGFMDKGLVNSVRRIEYNRAIPWPLVMKKIDLEASRGRAMKQTWAGVAGRVLAALKDFRK
jgi:hypothetical protein